MTPLPVVQVAAIAMDDEGPDWLVEGLWAEQGVGIVAHGARGGIRLF